MKTADNKPLQPILETAAALYCAIQRLTEQEPGPQDPLFTINNFQLIAAFGRARAAFHNAMGARPNVHTNMFVPPSGDLRASGERVMQAVTSLAIVVNGIATSDSHRPGDFEHNKRIWQFRQSLPSRRSEYRLALEEFGTALGYPVYDPGALSYTRQEGNSPLYFD